MGDIVTLVEKATTNLSDEKIKKAEEELKEGQFTMDHILVNLNK